MEAKDFSQEWNLETFLHTLRGWLLVLVLTCLFGLPSTVSFAQKYHKQSLNIGIQGVNAQASTSWVAAAGVMSPTRERYIIVPGKRQRQQGLSVFSRLLRAQSFDYNVSSVGRKNVIRIDDPRSPEGLRQLEKIASKENVTVIIDMDIGAALGGAVWGPQTEWAGEVAATLANEHLKKYSDSHTVLVAHSAGTQAMVSAQKWEKIAKRQLFKKSIAASPMDWEGLSPNTSIVLADGDLLAVPEGKLNPLSVAKSNLGRRAENLAGKGYKVYRVKSDAGHNWLPSSFQLGLKVAQSFERHSATWNFYDPDQNVLVYLPHSNKPVEIQGTSLAKVINTVDEAFRSPSTPSHGARIDFQKQKMNEVVKTLRQNEPTPGLGGISLNATARIPLDPRQVSRAGYDSQQNRLYIHMQGEKRVFLPRMNAEVLRLAYESAYRHGKKPELSIGTSHFTTPKGKEVITLHPPGKQPVYYLGKAQGNLLGLVMYRADEALAKLAFGSTSAVRPVAEQVPGFRSLPELYPEKYTEHPASERYAGSDVRVFINPTVVEFALSPQGDALTFSRIAFAARFGKSGAAEAEFAAFFASYFHEISNTEQGAPLKALIPFARAVAVFRWLKENEIHVDLTGLSKVQISKVYTPQYVSAIRFPSLDEIAPRLPTMFFGPFGPVRIIRADGRETVISYKNGLPVKVKRYDGEVLEVFRDDLGMPIALRMNEKDEAAFYADSKLGPVFAENVRLHGKGGNLSLEVRRDTLLYPDNQPEATVSLIVVRFALPKGDP